MFRSLLTMTVLAAPLLAGCLGNSVSPTALPVGLPSAQPLVKYLCPGAEGNGSAEPCFTQIARDDATLQEPFAAVHPANPRIMAIGVNLGPPYTERLQGLPGGESHVCKLAVYVTEDGGKAWREAIAPPPKFQTGPLGPTPGQCAGDPALAFDDAGRLHVTGIATAGSPPGPFGMLAGDNRGFVTYYVRSDDLGKTWGEPVVVSDNGASQDRNWITRDPASGTLWVDWQNTEGGLGNWTTELAWSADDGARWQLMDKEKRPRCYTDGPVALLGGEVLFSCVNSTSDEETRIRVYAFDPATGDSTLRGEVLEQGYWPFLTAFRDGRLAMHYDVGEQTFDTQLLWSSDGGRTWANPTSLRGVAEGAWRSAHSYWAEADPWGGYHVLAFLQRHDGSVPLQGPFGGPFYAQELRHLVFNATGAKVEETKLAAWSTKDLPAPRLAQGLGDHFYGLAWGQDRALLAFTRDAALQLTLALPALPT
jgi:hypothetical protein